MQSYLQIIFWKLFVAASIFLWSSDDVAASSKWRLFSKPDKPIQALTILFVDPPTSENAERQKNFNLSGMGMPTCADWIGQRAASLLTQSGVETVFGGTYNRREIASVLNRKTEQNFRLLLTPTDVSTGRDGMFGPTFAHVSYRVRLYAPDSSDIVVFESTSYYGNSKISGFNDFHTWQLAKELVDAGLISSNKSVRPEPIATPVESCPVLVK